MKSIFAILGLAFLLTACTGAPDPQIVSRQYVVVQIPAEYFKACPEVSKLPNPTTLRDIQVARALEKAYSGHARCKAAVDAIQKYINEAEKQFSQPASQ